MSAGQLTSLVPPPSQPFEAGTARQYGSILKILKLKLKKLPADFLELMNAYGSGAFFDQGRIRVKIYNPLAASYRDSLENHHTLLEAMQEAGENTPYPIYPKKAGLFAIGSDDNGNELYWLTKGEPDAWPIVVRTPQGEFEEFTGPLTSFLLSIFSRSVTTSCWPEPFFTHPGNLIFEPTPPPAPPPVTRTIYELYVRNGNKAGFWCRRIDARAGMRMFIRTIDGLESGKLDGIPEDFKRQPIVADVYYLDQLRQKDAEVSGYRPMFVFDESK